jgi:uncharacterized alpha-E superfamily protein
MKAPAAISRERWLILSDLRAQLPRTRGPLRGQTERAIRQIEVEMAGGRGVALEMATK